MDKATKIKALEKKAKDRERQKKKSCKPPKDGAYIDPINQPSSGIRTSLSGVCSAERWEKIFGSKNNKKKSDKKT